MSPRHVGCVLVSEFLVKQVLPVQDEVDGFGGVVAGLARGQDALAIREDGQEV